MFSSCMMVPRGIIWCVYDKFDLSTSADKVKHTQMLHNRLCFINPLFLIWSLGGVSAQRL